MSDNIVFRMKVRREDEVVRGRRGKSVWRSLEAQRMIVGYGVIRAETKTYVIEVMTFLFRSITRFCTRHLRVSGESVP